LKKQVASEVSQVYSRGFEILVILAEMAREQNLKQSAVAALVLAGITFFVFFTLRDFGPGSAVRRFHEDILTGNVEDLQKVCSAPITDPDVQRLAMFTNDERSSVARLASMSRSPDEVDVLVLYEQDQVSTPFVWVVTKHVAGWEVDAAQTVRANPSLQNG
jgi:hypothetical protein